MPKGGLVSRLINYFVDLCLLRVAPQDLPASLALFGLTLFANVLMGILLMAGAQPNPLLALGQSLLEVLLLLLVLRVALSWRGYGARFIQTATAILGSGALMSLLALALLGLGDGGGALAALGGLLLLLLVVWSAVVLGHILRHAFELPFGQAVIVAAVYTLVSYWVVATLFPIE